FGRREAVIALFCLACVLASSREPGLSVWKMLRLVPASLMVLEAMRIFRSEDQAFRRRILRWGALLVALTALPALVSDFVLEGLEESLLLATMWPMMATVAISGDEREFQMRMHSLIHLAVSVLLACMVVHVVNEDVSMLKGRFRGVFGNPNELSHWLLPFALTLLAPAIGVPSRVKWSAIAGACFLFFLTGTRGAMLALVLAVLGVWLIHATIKRWLVGVVLIAGFAMFFVSQISDFTVFDQFVPHRFVRNESAVEGGGRMIAWSHAWSEIQKRPLWGGGGGFEQRYFSENYSYFSTLDHEGMSHNSLLAFAMDFGLLSSLCLVISLFSILGLFKGDLWLFAVPALLFSVTVEGWLTAPMSACSPAMFFVAGLLGSASTNLANHLLREGH
ncbi:MAG: O-antigen ligase family protein, partial [Flavobacteriales bacterium]